MIARTRRRRPGYAMVAVVVFVMLFLGLWGLAARQMGSMLRIEQARAGRVARDAANLPSARALAQALAALEVGYPPSRNYTCMVYVDGASFSATFTTSDGAAWNVAVAPIDAASAPLLDPSKFVAAPPSS